LASKLALDIEDCLYGMYKENLRAYGDKARSIIFNLKDTNNPKLRKRILHGLLTPMDVVTCDVKELASDEKLQEIEKVLQE
jgi:transcription elongation factor S-II